MRTLKYSRYLREHDWRVTVIAPQTSAYTIIDPALETQLDPQTRVVRTPYRNTKRDFSWRAKYPALLALPDVWIGWLPWAVAAGRKVLAEDPVDVLFSTSPHATAHLIAMRLASRSGLPWVIDFRDPWIEEPPEPGAPNGLIFRTINRRLERFVVERSAAVVTSTTQLRDTLAARYPGASPKLQAIMNGYDEADFPARSADAPPRGSRLRIVHAGSINGEFRDPRPIFAALGRCVRSGALSVDALELRFLGGGAFAESVGLAKSVTAAGLDGAVSFLPRVPYDESLRELAAADALLLLQASEDTVDLVPAKLYEYLRAQKPTLALVHPGAVRDVLVETGGGWAADPRDAGRLDAVLGELIGAWREDRLADHCADLQVLRRFDRRTLTGELAAVFDRVAAR